jgi:hypothetical protein
MQEAEQHISAGATAMDGDATLVTPRFDEAEAQTAQAVVPLAAVRRRQRVWPLLLLAALLGGVVSVGGLYLYQRPRAQAIAAPAAMPQEQAVSAPPQTAQLAPATDDARAQMTDGERTSAVVATEAAVQPKSAERATTAPERAPVPRSAGKKEAKEQTARVAVEPRTHRATANEARGIEVGARHNAELNGRPREVQPRDARPQHQTRNVDRIRDIFEGARPPE